MPATTEDAAAWLDRERANLVEAVRWAYEHGRLTQCWQLACALWPYFHFGKHTDDWLATHDYALRASLDLPDTAAEAMVREQLGVAYWMANRDTEAAHHNQRALALYRQSGDAQGQGAVLGMLGRIAARAGRYPEALRQFAASLDLLRQAGDRVEEAHVLNSTAILRYRRGEVEEASAAFGAALVLFRAVGDGRSEARVLDNVGYIELSAGRFGEALELFERALRLRERLMDRRPSQLLNNLALAYRGLGQTHDALRHHLEALESSRQADDERGECEVLNDLAETLIRLDRTAEARSRYEEALDIAVRCADQYQQARAHEGIASVDEEGDPLGHLRLAIELYESLGVPDAARVRARTDG
jgi:tetratricopeptide (TPR) repeat protein